MQIYILVCCVCASVTKNGERVQLNLLDFATVSIMFSTLSLPVLWVFSRNNLDNVCVAVAYI